jgi:hypothetical protein
MPADEIPTYMRFASFGSSAMEWRQRPPAPGVQFFREGCLESPFTSDQVLPSSSLRKSAAGAVPA